jgi:hypothetical protein
MRSSAKQQLYGTQPKSKDSYPKRDTAPETSSFDRNKRMAAHRTSWDSHPSNLIINFQKPFHFNNPALINKFLVQRMRIISLIVSCIREFHRESEGVIILGTHLSIDIEVVYDRYGA